MWKIKIHNIVLEIQSDISMNVIDSKEETVLKTKFNDLLVNPTPGDDR